MIEDAPVAGRPLSPLDPVALLSSHPILQTDPRGLIIWVNDAFEALTGFTSAEAMGKTPGSLLQCPDTNPQTIRAIREALAARVPIRTPILNRSKAGRFYWLDLEIQPVFDGEGVIQGFQAIEVDVTDLMETLSRDRAALDLAARREATVANVAQLAGVGSWEVELETNRVIWTDQARHLLDLDPGMALTLADSIALFTPEARPIVEAAVALGVASGEPYKFEQPLITPRGRAIWIRVVGRLVTGAAEPSRLVGAIQDVTGLRAEREALQAALAAAEAATIAKSEFLANMSHEIRTPLTGVLGFAGLLEKLPDLPETARSYAGRIATSGQALLSVVNDILDFSKLEADRVTLDPHPFDPWALVAETVALVAAEAGRKGLTLTTEFEGEPPAAVLADSARVRQVLLNLLSNAIKFTKAGQITIKLGYCPEAGGELRVAVADSGIGIPADQVDRLFQRFSQVDGSNTRVYGGTGLGLAISKSLAELMGGRIGAESSWGKGSTFWFTLAAPRAELARPEPAAAEAQVLVAADARILVVDDVAMNRELVRTMLAPFAYDITEAANGADAVRAALSVPFDLILMDLQMPGMDGLAATRAIRATSDLNQQTPIVALSANVLPIHIAECRDAGMDDHIAKPISPADLLTKIAHWTLPEEVDTPQSEAR
ncbi:MAG: ATP-binding protein [Pseudomonadota bacterium]